MGYPGGEKAFAFFSHSTGAVRLGECKPGAVTGEHLPESEASTEKSDPIGRLVLEMSFETLDTAIPESVVLTVGLSVTQSRNLL